MNSTPSPGVLVVDDDPVILDVVRRILGGAGYVVQDAINGKAALACYERRPCDVVITDLQMPIMEGLELIRTLRRDHPAAKIVAMSGGVGAVGNYLDVAMKFGAGWTLEKPFSQDQLLATVAEAIASPVNTPAR